MQFDHDIFISYAHIDNETLSEEQEGWVSMLHRALEKRLAMELGERPRIWRDRKLQGNDRFDGEIVDNLLKTAVFVSVFSPRYVKSQWCLRELEEFIDKVEAAQLIDIGNKSRVFKIIKTPIDREQHPSKTQGMTGYEFFREDPNSGRLREFVRGFGAYIDLEFWERLYDLAQDIRQMLETVKNPADGSPPPLQPQSGRTVYLAQTTFEMNDHRDLLRRELDAYGHTVLPDQALLMRGPELEAEVSII